MSGYDARPWLALYDGHPADYVLEHDDALAMFRAGLAADPTGDALRYVDGSLRRQEIDEQSDALACALLAHGFTAGDRLAVYLQNVPQFVVAMVATWKAGGVMVSIKTVKAFVSVTPGATVTPEELIAHCKARMSAYKYPRLVVLVDELPKTVTGKILRRELRAT